MGISLHHTIVLGSYHAWLAWVREFRDKNPDADYSLAYAKVATMDRIYKWISNNSPEVIRGLLFDDFIELYGADPKVVEQTRWRLKYCRGRKDART